MKKLLFIPVLALSLLSFGTATVEPGCTCPHAGAFLTVAPKTRMVALVKINEHLLYTNGQNTPVPMAMEVEIIDVYRGREDRNNIVIWGNAGNMCRPDISIFAKSGYYILALDYAGGNPLYDEPGNDYSISICGDYWLSVEDFATQTASGKVADGQHSITLKELKEKLNG